MCVHLAIAIAHLTLFKHALAYLRRTVVNYINFVCLLGGPFTSKNLQAILQPKKIQQYVCMYEGMNKCMGSFAILGAL